jgi:hypothetical protein
MRQADMPDAGGWHPLFRNWPRLSFGPYTVSRLSSEITRRRPIALATASPLCESKRQRTSNSPQFPLDFVDRLARCTNHALSLRKASIPALSPRSTLCERTNCGTGRPLAVYICDYARGTEPRIFLLPPSTHP